MLKQSKIDISYYMSAGDGAFISDGRNVEMRTTQSEYKFGVRNV